MSGPVSAFTALGGSPVGGVAGSAVEHTTADTTTFEYIVRKANGNLVSVTQKDKTPLALGQKVLVIAGNQARVVPDHTVPPGQGRHGHSGHERCHFASRRQSRECPSRATNSNVRRQVNRPLQPKALLRLIHSTPTPSTYDTQHDELLNKLKGPLNSRPKYWDQLVIELIYDTLDPDVARFLRENPPPPGVSAPY